LRIEKFSIINEKLLPFINKYPLQSNKYLDYLDFKKACALIKEKRHLTQQGLKTLKEIKAGMNTKRIILL
jgi:hypothetical protein